MMTFGEYIRELRGDKPQRVIAKKAGISPAALSRYENDERDDMYVSCLLGLADALKVDVVKLLRAFKGLDPDEVQPDMDPQLFAAAVEFVKALPKVVIDEATLK